MRITRSALCVATALGCALVAACGGDRAVARVPDGSSATDTGAACPPDADSGAGANCVSGVGDLPPLPVVHFQTQLPRDDSDYPYSPDALPAHNLAPRTTVFLSADGSADPEGQAVSIFWNVRDPSGAYLALDPDPGAFHVSFSTSLVGPHDVTLEVTEAQGLRQTGQRTFRLVIAPSPCADDGVSAPCSDQLAVPEGSFLAGSPDGVGDGNEHPQHLTTIAPFSLDQYEVTVGRFRRFVTSYPGVDPADGAGAHPLVPDSGWQATAWNGFLPQSQDEFRFALQECGGTWTEAPQGTEGLPISCVTWFEAFAFCLWDGKRLPTEAEWEYAAVGGDQQRTYPWGETPPSADLAVFGCLFDGRPSCSELDLPPAGSVVAGAGRWGHQDLAGSLWEWTLDGYAPYDAQPCDNCANVTGLVRVFRGGDYQFSDPSSLRGATRYAFDAASPDQSRGFRCARTVVAPDP